jgi:ribosomal protein S18 acetylase RimI-like enzyme
MTADAAMDAPWRIRHAGDEDRGFILGLVPRFTGFALPAWRTRRELDDGIRRDLSTRIDELPPGSWMFIAEGVDGTPVGFLHLMQFADFFTGGRNGHVSDLAVAEGFDGRGIGRFLLDFAEAFCRDRGFERMQLAVFPGNTRALALYEALGYGIEMHRMVKPIRR